jgi:hypothetical protein
MFQIPPSPLSLTPSLFICYLGQILPSPLQFLHVLLQNWLTAPHHQIILSPNQLPPTVPHSLSIYMLFRADTALSLAISTCMGAK